MQIARRYIVERASQAAERTAPDAHAGGAANGEDQRHKDRETGEQQGGGALRHVERSAFDDHIDLAERHASISHRLDKAEAALRLGHGGTGGGA
jgi:hypothetical protein